MTGVSECSQQRSNLKDDRYKSGSNYGPVVYRTTEVDLKAGPLVLTLHEEKGKRLSGEGLIQHIEFLGL
ncbi:MULTISPECIES: hypothetical protein [Photorhabdus]|uniref:Uncharacterized protein n=1 Tax=Photorhabdus kayaii TaxID=230088 RepID=A0ABX0AVP7_9GAMM|nr:MULTISPECIES: hypothetical protein [Photorhabdus]MCC8376144.1 hypothetical protein [Photorhabdus bodei]MCT8354112.1 hypothetical protein [Photorhabdus kayaii]MDB6367639.1 hypothetical protein [Photorhabdus bodei]NDL11256.1 hypothetical protein [Photorhabdus kayaii]NDL24887.1 hypothetical protein [Photorhabdus kayaii]